MSGTSDTNWRSYGPIDDGTTVDAASWQAIRVKLWDAEIALIAGTSVKITPIPKWVWLPYFLFRRLTNPKAV